MVLTKLKSFIFFSLSMLIIGCSGGGGGGPKGTVYGKISTKDGPMPGGKITFISTGDKGQVPAQIKEDGTYSVEVPAGECKITIDPLPQSGMNTADMMQKQMAKMSAEEKEKASKAYGKSSMPGHYVPVNKIYQSVKTTPESITVKSGKNEKNITLN